MSIIKSFSVGDGDMFYIQHGSNSFSIIDCSLTDETKEEIVEEIKQEMANKGIMRFISTHPHKDHFQGLEYLDDEINIINFYCVKNSVIKDYESADFDRYCQLRDSEKAFYLYEGCRRRWLNKDGERGSAGLIVLWPDTNNKFYKEALSTAEEGDNPNNISIILEYSIKDGAKTLWMGDLEKEFMENIKDEVTFPKINALFAPHHGRKSGKLPIEWLEEMDPDIVVMGEAPSENLDYAAFDGYNKITQNSAGDITFECVGDSVHIYVSNPDYEVDFLNNEYKGDTYDNYLGTLNL